MTYSINTSKYTAKKAVEINGINFKVRKITTTEQFELSDLQAQVKKLGENAPSDEVRPLYDKSMGILFGLFDDEKKAREIFKDMQLADLANMYKDIMENAPDATD